MLFNIATQQWDPDLLQLFGVARSVLPEVRDSVADYGTIDAALFGDGIPICGVAGDQQAAAVGQACFSPGMAKCTYGTGAFLLINVGSDLPKPAGRAAGDRRFPNRKSGQLRHRRHNLQCRRHDAVAKQNPSAGG